MAEERLIGRRVLPEFLDTSVIKPFDILLGTSLEDNFTGSRLASDLSNEPSIVLGLNGSQITPAEPPVRRQII